MNADRLRHLVTAAINSGVDVSEWEEGGIRLTVRRVTGVADAPGADTTLDLPAAPDTIHSTMFGQFHLHPEKGAPPFVAIGDLVAAGQRVGLIEAMKTFSPVVTGRAGRIVAVLAEHGAEVAFGQPLFRVE